MRQGGGLSRRALQASASLSAIAVALVASGAAAQAPEPEIEEIIVRGYRLSVERALTDKRAAEGIQDGVSADDLGRLPNKNSAESLARLPGVNITQDQGEGRYVSIRGASPNLNAITVNGMNVGTVEVNTRRIPLDIVGGELLGGIDVIKAVTPDMEANAVGGIINVKTPSPFKEKGRFFGRATAQIGDQELDRFHPYAVTLTAGGKLGSDEALGVLAGVSYTDRHYLTKGLYADDWRPVPGLTRGAPESHKFNDYDLNRERLTLTGVVEYKPDEGTLYYLRALWTSADETEARYRGRNYFTRTLANVTLNGDGTSGRYVNQRLRSEFRDQSTERRIGNFAVGGENTFGNLKIDYAASLVRNTFDRPTKTWTFQSPDIFSGTFNMAEEFFEVVPNVAQIGANVSRIGINAYAETLAYTTDRGYELKVNGRYDLTGDQTGYLKAGAVYRSITKRQDNTAANYTPGTGGAAAFNVGSPGVWNGVFLEGRADGTYYQVGPKLDREGLLQFTAANLNNTVVLRRDAAASLAGSTNEDYDVREQVIAGYAMGSLELGDFNLLAGARLEHTKVRSRAFDLINRTTVRAVERPGSYTHVLPGLHVRFNPNDSGLVVRGAWTNTIGRPEYQDISGRRELTTIQVGPGALEGSLDQSNPDLKAFKSKNLDLSVEYYFADGHTISAAAFYKDIDGFIFEERLVQNNVTFDGVAYSRLTTETPRNAENGKIKGAEFNYQQQFTFLPQPFDGLGAGLSFTIVDSHVRVSNRPDRLPFIGQADRVYSVVAFYEKGPLEIVGTYAWADDILFTVGAGPDLDLYDEDYGRIDVKATYRLTDAVSLFMELQNLNDAPLGEFQGRDSYVTRKELYGRTGYLGVTLKW